ncbi:MAG: SRPBCC family protein [Sandaracinaceae bacterium]
MKTQSRLSIVEGFPVSAEALFAKLLDHEGMSEWSGARVKIVAGPRDGGVGTVRRIEGPGVTIDEEVVYVDAPRRLVYRIVRGLPLLGYHRGEMIVEPWGRTGSQLTWDILMDMKVPGMASAVTAMLGGQLREGLGRLRRSMVA